MGKISAENAKRENNFPFGVEIIMIDKWFYAHFLLF